MRWMLLLLFVASPTLGRAAEPVQYNRDVRPILSDACFPCHGPDGAKRKAKLRLDVRDNALERGAIVPGKPAESELVARLKLPVDDPQHMPPPDAHKALTKTQEETLIRWIAEGAPYQPHWAYMPLSLDRPTKSIDSYIDAELAKKNGKRAPQADRRTLARRLTLDLTGLPPTPEELQAFLADTAPDAVAIATLVDRLLASPHYGERMAAPWLDLVRFADTVGYHGDQNQRIFPYRDYVIDSFNNNKPFNIFTR
ncbi:MAG: DUF1549 domain-containing protein, partial [Gemmataceae bacterium]